MPIPKRSPRVQRVMAWALGRSEAGMAKTYGTAKAALLAELRGDIVEIGPGTGANLPYYAEGVRVIGIEPNRYMAPYLTKKAKAQGIHFELAPGHAENLPLEDASADAVVSTLVLCSVFDLDRVLAEAHRVLRPGGRFVFLEHVAAPRGSWTRRFQHWVKPVWRYLGDGCCPDREIERHIEQAGFACLEIEHRYIHAGLPLIGRHIAGKATR